MSLDLDSVADFSWDFGHIFYLETRSGLYEWSDPDYGGDNIIRRSRYSSLEERYAKEGTPTRSKGRHVISRYCGPGARLEPQGLTLVDLSDEDDEAPLL